MTAVTVKCFASGWARGEDRPTLPSRRPWWRRIGGGEPLAGSIPTAVNLEYAPPPTLPAGAKADPGMDAIPCLRLGNRGHRQAFAAFQNRTFRLTPPPSSWPPPLVA